MALTLNDLIDPKPAASAGGLGLARYQAVMNPQAPTTGASPIERYKQIQQERPESPIERYRRLQPQTAAAVETPERMPKDAAGVERAPGAGHPATEFAARGLAAVPSSPAASEQAKPQMPQAAQPPSGLERFRAMQPKPREAVQAQPGGPSPADIIKAKYAGDLEAGWNVGVKSMQSLGAGAVGALGQAVGSDSMREWGVGHMERLEREMQPWMAGRPTKLEDIKGAGDAADWAQFTLAQVAPSILESIGAAVVGGALGSAAAPGAGTAVGALGGAAAKGAVKGALSKYLAKATSEGMLRGATREAAEQAAKRTVGAQAGAAIGMFGSSYLQGVGDVYGETLGDDKRGDLLSSFALAVPYAALDSVVEMGVLGKIMKGSPGEEALKRYTRAILGTAVKEGSTEAAQEALVLLAGVKNDQEYSSEEVLSRLGNGFAAGFLAGGVMGAPAGRAQREQVGFGDLVVDVLPGGEDPVNGMARPELRTALTDPSMPDPVRARAFAAVTAALEGLDPVMGAAFKDVAAEALARRTTAVPTDAFMTAMTGGRRAGEVEQDAASADVVQSEAPTLGGVTDPGPSALAEQVRAAREAQWAEEDAARAAADGQPGGDLGGDAFLRRQAEATDPVNPLMAGGAKTPNIDEVQWTPEPLDSQMVEGRGGLWTREVQRSADGAWVLERAITPDGELARERVQPFEGWAQNKRAGIDAAEESARAQVRRWRVENPNTPEPKEMADELSELRAQRQWLDGVERAGKTPAVGEEVAEIRERQTELYRKALVGERVSKAVAEAPETAWLRERFAGAEEAPTAEAIGAALREYQPDAGVADEFAAGDAGAGQGDLGSGEAGAVGGDDVGAGRLDADADRRRAVSGDEAEALAPGAQGLPTEQVEGQGAAESAELLTPERPAFVPTHVLSDGTPVEAVGGESNVYRDASGIEIEDDYADVVQQPMAAAEPESAGAREPGALAEAAAAEPGAGRGAVESAGAGGRAVGAGEPVSGADDAPALTAEAAEVLKTVEEGGLPFARTRNLERIAAENGVEVTPETTPEQIVTGLRERVGQPLSHPEELGAPNPHPLGTLAHDLEQAARAADAEAARWEGKRYKDNKSKVAFEGDGPVRDGEMSIGAINAGRKQKAIEAAQREAAGLRQLAAMPDEVSLQIYSDLRRQVERNGAVEREVTEKTVDDQMAHVLANRFGMQATGPGSAAAKTVAMLEARRVELERGRSEFAERAEKTPDAEWESLLFGEGAPASEPAAEPGPAAAWDAASTTDAEGVKQRIGWLRQAGLRGAGLGKAAWGDMTPEQQQALAGAMKPAEQPSGNSGALESVRQGEPGVVNDGAGQVVDALPGEQARAADATPGAGEQPGAGIQPQGVVGAGAAAPGPDVAVAESAGAASPELRPGGVEANDAGEARIAGRYAALFGETYGAERAISPERARKQAAALARAIREKDAYALGVSGQNLIDSKANPVARRIFEEETGVALPKQQSGSWKAIRAWAGVSDAQDQVHSAKKAADQARARLSESRKLTNGVEWVDTQVAAGFDELVQADGKWLLRNPKTNQQFNLTNMVGAAEARPYLRSAIALRQAEKLAEQEANNAQDIPTNPAVRAAGQSPSAVSGAGVPATGSAVATADAGQEAGVVAPAGVDAAQPTETRAPAVGEGATLPDQKGRFKYRVASVQPEQQGGYVRIERARKSGNPVTNIWTAVTDDGGNQQLSREYVLKTFGVRAVHRGDDLRGTGVGDEIRQQRETDALAARQQQAREKAAADNLSDRAQMALRDLMLGRPETVRKDVARGNLTADEAMTLVERLEADNALAGGNWAAEKARQQIELGRADATTHMDATPTVAGQPAGTGRGAAADGRDARSEQFESYRKAIQSYPTGVPAGLLEQIRVDERLNEGEAEALEALTSGVGRFSADELVRQANLKANAATDQLPVNDATLSAGTGKVPDAGSGAASDQLAAGGPYKIGDKVLYESVITGEKNPAAVIRVRRDDDGKEFVELDTGERGIPASSPQLSRAEPEPKTKPETTQERASQFGPDRLPLREPGMTVQSWWRHELTLTGRRTVVREVGLNESVSKKSAQHLTVDELARIEARYPMQQAADAEQNAAQASTLKAEEQDNAEQKPIAEDGASVGADISAGTAGGSRPGRGAGVGDGARGGGDGAVQRDQGSDRDQQSDGAADADAIAGAVGGAAGGPLPGNVRGAGRVEPAERGDAAAGGQASAVPGGKTGRGSGPGGDRGNLDGDRADAPAGDPGRPGARGVRQVKQAARDLRAKPEHMARTGSWYDTAVTNVGIVELAVKIIAEKRPATPSEQIQLAGYVGFGAGEIRNNLFPVLPEWMSREDEPGSILKPNGVRTFHATKHQYLDKAKGEREAKRWGDLAERLVALPQDWQRSILRSTQYAHYTSPAVVSSIWRALQRFGFQGGRILEPGMGKGNFPLLMPEDLYQASIYTGVEFDGPTAEIARLLLPQQVIKHADYTNPRASRGGFAAPHDFYDAAVGNPPFSRTKITSDPEYAKLGLAMHDFFFAKTLDRVKPGGLMVFVTSRYTMDKANDAGRKYLAQRADLIGAIRMPQTAFKENAGTDVVTDVLFLRKRHEGEAPAGAAWESLKEVESRAKDGTVEGAVKVNEYFAGHPEMVLGQIRIGGTGAVDDMGRRINALRPGELVVVSYDEPAALERLFDEAVDRLPQNVYSVIRDAPNLANQSARVDFDPKAKREGVLYLGDDGEVMRVEYGIGVPIEDLATLRTAEQAWLKGYVALRDAVQEARFAQLEDGQWEAALQRLNTAYDAFVADNGPVMAYRTQTRKAKDDDGVETEVSIRVFKNKRLWTLDFDASLVTQLEQIKEDGSIVKGPFLRERTVAKAKQRSIESAADALAVSLDELGRLDMKDIGQRLGLSERQVQDQLGDLVFRTPQNEWVLSDDYLSGFVRDKLQEAKAAAEADPRFERNVKALEAAQPQPLSPVQITVQLGAGWVPDRYVSEFAFTIGAGEVTYDTRSETWKVEGGNKRNERSSAATYGTADRSPSEILEAVLNNRQLVVKRTDSDKKTYTDQEATAAINEIARRMRQAFKSWVWTDTERATDLVSIYNERMNNIALRRFDGSHLTLPGISLRFNLYPHQRRVIWRIVQTGNTYLAHAVGAGKTIEMIASGMEMKRLGLINKPMYVVPNHMLEQWANEFMETYPLANLLVADNENFSKDRRAQFMAAAAMNNPDAIIITHSAFKLIGVNPETAKPIRDGILDELREALSNTDSDERVRRNALEQQIENIEKRFETLMSKAKDTTLTFEELGADFLFVDEAHNHRKLDFTTNRKVKGVDPNGSWAAMDLYVKTRWLDQQRPGRGFVMASGTPVTNTVGELYTIQRFFDEAGMERDGMSSFDAWANAFGEVASDFERNAAGKLEPVERFAAFSNVPELMNRVRQFMDVLTGADLGGLVKRPDLEGGKPNMVLVEQTPELRAYMTEVLTPRLEKSKAWKPTKDEPFNRDPVMAIANDARLASIDMRYVNPSLASDTPSKLNAMGDAIAAEYAATRDLVYVDDEGKPEKAKGGAQIVFFNLGLGAMVQKNRGFNARKALTDRIVAGGVPREKIAWFEDADTDAKKEAIFGDMRSGRLAVLIGSAKKMGTGVNVQKRLTALQYLDPPWYPADVEQPHGRIIRQKNQNPTVRINWFSTKETYEATMWQMVARKQRFIDQALSGDPTLRRIEDISEASQFEMAAALVSGDPRVMELAAATRDMERYAMLQRAHITQQGNLQRDLKWELSKEKTLEKRIRTYRDASAFYGGHKTFASATIGKGAFDKRDAAGEALIAEFNRVVERGRPGKAVLGVVNGQVELEVEVSIHPKNGPEGQLIFRVKEAITHSGYREARLADVDGGMLIAAALRFGNGLTSDLESDRRSLIEAQQAIQAIKRKIGAPFEYEQELIEATATQARLRQELMGEGVAVDSEQDPGALAMDSEGGGQAVRFSRADAAGKPSGGPGAALSPALQRTLRRMQGRGKRGAAGGLVLLSGSAAERAAAFAKATGRRPDGAAARALAEGRAQGAFDPKTGLLFVAGDLDAETAAAVLLHEATHGQRRPALDARVQALLAGDAPVPKETRVFLDRVQARMARVGESGAQGEALAYVVEAAALEGRKAGFSAIDGAFLSWVDGTLGQPIGDLLRRLTAQLRAWALRMGLPMNPAVDDLLALARGDLKRAARGQVVTEADGARVFETAPVFSRSGPKPSDAVLIDGREVFGELTAELSRDAKQQSGMVLTPAPIRLLNGKHEGLHKGFGLAHIEAEHGDEIRALGMSAPEFVGKTIGNATQIWKDGSRLVLARTGRRGAASVIELREEGGYYSVVTAFPVTNPFKTFGDLVWRGRALASMTPLQAKDLNSPRAPLTDQQQTSPPEPLSGKDALHPPLETLRGQPGDTKIGVADAEGKSGADSDILKSMADTIDVDGTQRPTTNSEGRAIHPTEDGVRAFWRWFSPSPSQLLDGLSVAEVSGLKRDSEALADFIESQAGLSEPDRFTVVPSSVLTHVAGAVNNDKILDSVVRSLPVDVVNFLGRKQGSAKEVLHDAAMLKDVLAVDPASNVPLGVNPSRIAELTVRLVANAGAKISGLTSRALERNAAVLADATNPVLGAHVRKSPNGDLSIIAGFGDSKMVDAKGRPLVLYHSTRDNPSTLHPGGKSKLDFGLEMQMASARARRNPDELYASGPAIWMTDDKTASMATANSNTDDVVRLNKLEEKWNAFLKENPNAKKKDVPFDLMRSIEEFFPKLTSISSLDRSRFDSAREDHILSNKAANVMPLYAALRNPLVISSNEQRIEINEKTGGIGLGLPERLSIAQKQHLIRMGYDGVDVNYAARGLREVLAFDAGQLKSSIGNTGTFSVTDPDIRYSLATASYRGGSPLGGGKTLQESIKAFTAEPGAWSRDKWLGALPTVLGAVTLRQLADLGEGRLPGINAYNAVRQRMETRRNEMVEQSGQFAEEVWQRWAGKREHKAEAAELNDFIHRTTLDQVDPDRYETLKITVQLGPGSLFKRVREATQANVDELNKRARQLVRSKKLEDKGLAPYYQMAAKQLALAVRAEQRRLAKLPELAKRWAVLSDGQVFRKEDGSVYASEADAQRAIDTRKDLQGKVLYTDQADGGWVIQEAGAKQIYRRARDLYKQRGDEMMEALIARVAESRALDEVNKRALAAKIRAEFEQTMDEKGNPRVGPYFPLQRFGRFYTAARRFPTGVARTFRKMDGGAFASESAARSAIGRRADLREVDVKPVELKDGSGWVLEELGEPGFWMYEDTTEQRRDAMRLQAEGWTSLKQGLTQEAGKQGAEAVSEGFMAQAVKQLQDRGATDEADMLYQMYLQTLNQMSIRKHFIHRKGTAGYSDNALRSFGWNMTRLAHQVAKLEYVPQLERMMTDIEEGKKDQRNATPDADIRVEDAFFQELQKRHQWVVSPNNASWTNFTSALGFFWYLGVTPGAALVNLSQTPIVGLPVLASRFKWGPSARALGQAAVDVMRGFNPTVVKGFMTGTPRPSQAANLSADEQAAFDAWSVSGVRDRTRAHNLAGIGDTDAFWNGPTFNKGMAIVSSLFHAGEVVNRDVTLLAGYRLARKAGQSHAAAVRTAEEMTWESHFDYGNANRARAMQSNAAKVFLMFRSYSQHVTYFMWRNLYQWTKGETPEVRAEARTKFLGLMGMTAAFAGSAGLPMFGLAFGMANVMAALFGDDDEPWDAETEWRRWLAQTFPSTVGDILDRGVANTATGLDWSTRVSLRELWFRSPNRDLDGAGMYQHIVESILGPIGGIVGSPFTAADMIADGHWDRAAEAMTPKFLRDALKAGRYASEGVQTLRGDPVLESLSPYEIIWVGMGMQPDALRVQWDNNNAVKRYEGEILDRRSRLMTAAALAMIHGDRDGLANVTPKIERFNAAQPTIPITMQSLRTSVRNRIRYSEQAEGGISVNPRLEHLREVAG